MTDETRIVGVVGPSGVGKDSVMRGLVRRNPRFSIARRVITRSPDPQNEDFESVTEARFYSLRESGVLALAWGAHGLQYGVPKAELCRGGTVLVNLSRGVLEQAANAFGRFTVLSLSAPPDVLAQRLAQRGREGRLAIERRLARSVAIPDSVKCHIVDNSGPLEATLDHVEALIFAEQRRKETT